jgi:NADH-quinone oxidoreductase subunit K
MIPLSYYLFVSAVLFTIGIAGVLVKRNAVIMIMCIELMLNAVNLSFAAISFSLHLMDGQIIVFLIMTVAAAEVAVGLAIVVALFRLRETEDVDEVNLMKW